MCCEGVEVRVHVDQLMVQKGPRIENNSCLVAPHACTRQTFMSTPHEFGLYVSTWRITLRDIVVDLARRNSSCLVGRGNDSYFSRVHFPNPGLPDATYRHKRLGRYVADIASPVVRTRCPLIVRYVYSRGCTGREASPRMRLHWLWSPNAILYTAG